MKFCDTLKKKKQASPHDQFSRGNYKIFNCHLKLEENPCAFHTFVINVQISKCPDNSTMGKAQSPTEYKLPCKICPPA